MLPEMLEFLCRIEINTDVQSTESEKFVKKLGFLKWIWICRLLRLLRMAAVRCHSEVTLCLVWAHQVVKFFWMQFLKHRPVFPIIQKTLCEQFFPHPIAWMCRGLIGGPGHWRHGIRCLRAIPDHWPWSGSEAAIQWQASLCRHCVRSAEDSQDRMLTSLQSVNLSGLGPKLCF